GRGWLLARRARAAAGRAGRAGQAVLHAPAAPAGRVCQSSVALRPEPGRERARRERARGHPALREHEPRRHRADRRARARRAGRVMVMPSARSTLVRSALPRISVDCLLVGLALLVAVAGRMIMIYLDSAMPLRWVISRATLLYGLNVGPV